VPLDRGADANAHVVKHNDWPEAIGMPPGSIYGPTWVAETIEGAVPGGEVGGSDYKCGYSGPFKTSFRWGCGLEVIERIGSSGRTRTYNPSVNSRMLYH
jgi:hypothetical protein